jgi:hypothetical protein
MGSFECAKTQKIPELGIWLPSLLDVYSRYMRLPKMVSKQWLHMKLVWYFFSFLIAFVEWHTRTNCSEECAAFRAGKRVCSTPKMEAAEYSITVRIPRTVPSHVPEDCNNIHCREDFSLILVICSCISKIWWQGKLVYINKWWSKRNSKLIHYVSAVFQCDGCL